ncbi:MAG: flagellar filament capping protein FliD [Dissulfurimicrobium sp.]|uniref:flagellar filament capping protein FliD n=1 Tax=Dissulfurimicrobium sp. TaxID=2022436 RepID=UPI00404AF5F9
MAGTITSLGVGSGLQLQSILDQMRQVDQAPIDKLKAQQTRAQDQYNAFNTLNQGLLSIKAQALNLSLQSTFIKRDISTGPEGVISASVFDGAAIGTHQITVNQVAKASLWQGTGVNATTSVINSSGSNQTFAYHIGTGPTISLTVANGTTLQGLADLINNDIHNPGVTASIINDGGATNPYHLVLTANATGENSRIYIDTQLPDYNMTEIQGAGGASLNAQITVNGVTYQRGTNTGITDIINGVTLNILKPGSSSIAISSNTTSLKNAIVSMVNGFNSSLQSLKAQTGYTTSATGLTPGLLAGNSTMRGLYSQLTDLLGAKIDTGGSIKSMYDLGLRIARDGTVSIDSQTLDNALANHFNDVQRFFLGTSTVTGFGTLVNNKLRNITQAGTGVLAIEQKATQTQINQITQQINDATARLNKKYETLTKQFTQLDSFMSRMKSISTFLTSQLDAITETKKTN